MTYQSPVEALLSTTRPWLTDGGFETTLFFVDGFDAPLFAACVLLDDPKARAAMTRYFDGFLGMAAEARTGFVLDTNTWRAGSYWGPGLGLSDAKLTSLNVQAVQLAKASRTKWQSPNLPIIINGAVGPAGDGYAPEFKYSAEAACQVHLPQIRVLAREGVDMITGLTITHTGEAIGIVQAAQECGVPVVISFTLETDGRLPDGTSLADAIAETDAATGAAPIYYMINCAHPDHFSAHLDGGDWLQRIGGVRANASRLSHAELDDCEELDEGDPQEFGALHAAFASSLPNLRVIGGCCGTDHRHVGCVAHHLITPLTKAGEAA